MSKITINPVKGKARQYKAQKFHKIVKGEDGTEVTIRLATKDLQFTCKDEVSDLTKRVQEVMCAG